MLIPYSFIEQQWSVSWMNGGKQPLRKPRLTAWETPETLETRELSERSTSNLYQLKACTLLSQENADVSLMIYSDNSRLLRLRSRRLMGGRGGVQRRTTQAGQKLTQRTYTSTWISEPPESTEAAGHRPILNRPLQKPREWVTGSRRLLMEYSTELEEHKRQN